MKEVKLVGVLMWAWLLSAPGHADPCEMCAEWNRPHEPFKIYGNTYYVGTATLASILIVSEKGSVLIDGDHTDAPPQIVANIKKLETVGAS